MNPHDSLGHILKIRFGLPRQPTASELEEIFKILARKQAANSYELAVAVAQVCPGYNTTVYSGVDNSEINTILMMAIQAAKKAKGM